MTDPIYKPPSTPVADPTDEVFSWFAAGVAASAGTGASYLTGMLLSPLVQHFYAQRISDLSVIYQVMFSSPGFSILVLAINACGYFFAGQLAARMAPHGPVLHSVAAGGICIFVGAVAYLGVVGSPLPVWTQVAGFVLPIPCMIAGALSFKKSLAEKDADS